MPSVTSFNPFATTPKSNGMVTVGAHPGTPPPSPLKTIYGTADAATHQQADDYDSIMGGFKDLLVSQKATANQKPAAYTPTVSNYAEDPRFTDAINRNRTLAETGGYSGSDIADIRERGISPIRSIYANANRDIDRQRASQGGYSPNYGALKAKMAREMSNQLSERVSGVNADLAERVVGNKMKATDAYTSSAAAASSDRNRATSHNDDVLNEAARFNAGREDAHTNTMNEGMLRSLEGMRGLYGTTPALSSLFGNQAINSAQLQNSINQANTSSGFNMLSKTLSYPTVGRR